MLHRAFSAEIMKSFMLLEVRNLDPSITRCLKLCYNSTLSSNCIAFHKMMPALVVRLQSRKISSESKPRDGFSFLLIAWQAPMTLSN